MDDRFCPFCATPQRLAIVRAPFLISALVGLTMSACSGDDMGGGSSTGETTAATKGSTSETSNGSMSSTGVQTTSGTSTSGTGSSSSDTGTSSSTTDMTSGTTTSGTTTSGTTDSDSDSESDSEGACRGPGEQICDGICVNTDYDSTNCGKCDNVCEEDQACNEGECGVVIPPYGAPMPEPLWV